MLPITLQKEGYDPFIDYLKGVCIFLVVLAHCLPHTEYILFPLWGDRAVPLFLLIQVFHAYKHGVDEAVKMPNLVKLFNRIFKPFLLLLLFEVFLLVVVLQRDPLQVMKTVIIGGGIGPGSYYVWIYIQFALLLPIIALIIKLLNKVVGGGKICLLMIALSCLWELVCIYIHIPEMLYRLLFFRYFFLIYLGYMWVEKGILLDNIRLLLSVVSIAFILMFAYTSINFEPLFFQTDWKIYHWICYFYVASLFLFFLKFCYNRLSTKLKEFIGLMGKYSFEIFLLQMFVFAFFPHGMLLDFVGNKYICATLTIILTVSLSILPVIVWKRWRGLRSTAAE